jgi:hypothetical protein
VTLSIEGFSRFVTSTTAPIATGWSESLPGGSVSHWVIAPFHGAQNEAEPSNVRIFFPDILTFDGLFGSKSDILNPRWLLTRALWDEHEDRRGDCPFDGLEPRRR